MSYLFAEVIQEVESSFLLSQGVKSEPCPDCGRIKPKLLK
jgi:hypothetical protein